MASPHAARSALDAIVDNAARARAAGTALQVRVSGPGGMLYARDAGMTRVTGLDGEPPPAPVTAATRFDLASLTKPLCTTALILLLVRERRLALDEPPPAPAPAGVTVRHLLAHASGLPAWRPFHEAFHDHPEAPPPSARTAILQAAAAEPPECAPGEKTMYSDLGFIVLGWAIAQAAGARLDAWFAERIAAPLGLADRLGFRPARASAAPEDAANFAATERCPWRGRVLAGEVHDDNAWAMGGVAGHAGLYGDADAVDRLARVFCDTASGRAPTAALFDPDLLRAFWQPAPFPPPARTLGWNLPAHEGYSAAGSLLSRTAVGHTGFTGTSVWIDPESGLAVTLLTNRVHPSRSAEGGIRALRPVLHDGAVSLARASGVGPLSSG